MTYYISYKTLIRSKLLRITFDKTDGFIRIYDVTRYLHCLALKNITLFTTELEISVDSYDSLAIEKILTLCNVMILIQSVLNKDKNHYYYKIFGKNIDKKNIKT